MKNIYILVKLSDANELGQTVRVIKETIPSSPWPGCSKAD